MAVQLPRQDSVVLETLDLKKNEEKNDEMFDQPPPAEDTLYSPSWHPGTLPGEAMIIYEQNVAMELTSSVQATWLNNVAYVNNETITPKKSGVLIGTNFRLIYVDKVDKPHNFPISKNINLIPFNAIGNITFLITGKDESTSRTLLLWCKDWRLITLTFESPPTCSEMHKKLIERTVWSSIDNVFAFTQSASTYPPDMEHIMEFDFKRMQLDPSKWRLSKVNHDYNQIPTYPSTLIVPNSVSDAVMLKAGNFRCNARIPAVCWVSPTGTSISRTSQPRSGFFAKSEDDETLVKGIFSNNQQYANKTMYILDCRPRLSAVGNMAKGMGYEKPEGYSEHCCEIMWMGIDNIHAMRDSLRNMYKLCLGSQSDHKWLSNWEYTKWPDHLNFVLTSAVKMVELIQQGSSVLVHCSDGWDRTPQMTSLAQLLLDPYYRTIEGFLALITKEWISFGHQFQIRVGHGCSDFWNTDHCSPIFFQWIDCVWQVMQQFPHCFEFNSKFLIDLLDNLYNCYFFEFLFNSEKEMMQAKRCTSLWERYLKRPENFVNPFFHETNQPRVLYPDSSPKRLQFWAGYYLRYYNPKEEGMHYIEQKGREIIAARDQLADQLAQLKSQLEKEQAMRNQLEKQWNLAMNAEKEKDDIRRRSFECKVLSEGESTVWCKIGMDDMVTPPLKRIHIIDDYNPSNNHSFVGIENVNQDANHEELPVSPKRKNSRVDVHPMEVIEDPP